MRSATSNKAFTLVELLVVVTIIITLLAMLLPSMNAAIERAVMATCQSNQRQMAIAYTTYSADNLGAIMQGVPTDVPDAFVYSGAGLDPIKKGALYKYINNASLYRCPADPNGNERSYVIPGTLRGEGWTSSSQGGVDRISGVVSPAKQVLFMEESDSRGWNVGSWLIRCDDGAQWNWIDYVGLFHENQTADDFVFLDGHVQRRKWEDANTLAAGVNNQFYLYDPNNPDWTWIRPYYRQMATNGGCRYVAD